MPQLLATDLDGTILFQRQVLPEAIEALHAWRAAGNISICATGKSISATQHAIGQLYFDYYVLYTGAVVTDSDYQILHADYLPQPTVREILAYLEGLDNVAVFATTTTGPDRQLWTKIRDQDSTDILQSFVPLDPQEIDRHQFVGIPIWVNLPENEVTEVCNTLVAAFGDQVDCHQNQYFIDIVPKGSDKARGLERLITLRPELAALPSYTLGDSYNDVPMHQWADTSVSFPHSPKQVQQLTTIVAPSAAEFIQGVLDESIV